MSMLNDRFTRGFSAGFIGCIPVFIFNFIVYYLKISKLRYLDFATVFIYGHKSADTSEILFACLATFAFASGLGIIFAYFISATSSRNMVFKGIIFSVGSWFCIYAITVLFQVPGLKETDFLSALCNFVGSIIWGIALAYIFLWLDTKGKQRIKE